MDDKAYFVLGPNGELSPYVKSIILNYKQDSFVRFDEYFQSSVHYLSFKNFDFIGFIGPSMYLQNYRQTKYLTIIDINDFWLILA